MKLVAKKGLMLMMVTTMAMSTVYATPVVTGMAMQSEMSGSPVITGAGYKTHSVNQPFNPMDGISVICPVEGDITSKVEVTRNTVNTTKPGVYYVDYTVKNCVGITSTAQATIVVETVGKPFFAGVDDLTIGLYSYFDPMQGVTAMDGLYYEVEGAVGDITDKVVVAGASVNVYHPGTYVISYRVENAQGIHTLINRTINVVQGLAPTPKPEPEKPEQNLNPTIVGVEDVTVEVGGWYSIINGIKAYDVDGNDISNTISVRGDFGTMTPGVRQLTYTATDAQGRVTTVIRTITVVER